MKIFLSSDHNLNRQVWSVVSVFATTWRLCIHEIYFLSEISVYVCCSSTFVSLEIRFLTGLTVSRACKAFKTFVILVTFRWEVTCWRFWKMLFGFSGSSRFLPMFRHPWATPIAEVCRSGFSCGLSEEWISSWKTQVSGKGAGGRWDVSIIKPVLGAQGRQLLSQRKPHGEELIDSGRDRRAEILFLTHSHRQFPFWNMVSLLDLSLVYAPLFCLLSLSVSPSLGQNTLEKHAQAPPSSHVLLPNPVQCCVSE